jgi:hypothetical protein
MLPAKNLRHVNAGLPLVKETAEDQDRQPRSSSAAAS